MKEFKVFLFTVAIFCTTMNLALSQEKKERTVKEYKELINLVDNWSKNLNNKEFYKNFKFKNKETGKEFKFPQLKPLEQEMFMIFQAERLTESLESLHKEFQKDLELHKKEQESNKAKKDDDIALKGDIIIYTEELNKIRKSTALKFENYMESFFKENANRFSTAEADKYMLRLRSFHDSRKLINRKDEKKDKK